TIPPTRSRPPWLPGNDPQYQRSVPIIQARGVISTMPNIYYHSDATLELMQKKRIAVIGYGSQGHAHALNMHDNGCNVVVGLPSDSKSRAKAEAEGLQVMTPAAAAEQADVIMVLIPDQYHREVCERDIRPGLAPGKMLI